MKYWRSLVFLLIICLFSACIREDLSHCPVYTAELSFAYYGDGNRDIFHDKIHSTDLFLFDADGLFLERYRLGDSWLSENKTLRLSLPAGDYQVVTWGNLFSQSQVLAPDGVRHIDNYRITHPDYNTSRPLTTNDSLYYNRSRFTVVSDQVSQQVLLLRSAKIELILYAEIEQKSGRNPEKIFDPDIRFENLYTNYDFYMQLTGERVTFAPVKQHAYSGKGVLASSHVFRFPDSNPITIYLKDKEYYIDYRLSVEEFMRANHITVENWQEVILPIHIIFGERGNVLSVEVADWNVIDVDIDY
ncbi:MAG: FimB/Mfa2 family fimbrial subunit [Bacteroides sp.]|nr:FimB/Mfa2 family fimbrial subunit [Bacteroides sp.]